MKLFANIDRQVGEIIPLDTIFAWGKVTPWPFREGDDPTHYWCFTSPFTLRRPHLDYQTFALTKGPCHWRVFVRRDKRGKLSWSHGWMPAQ